MLRRAALSVGVFAAVVGPAALARAQLTAQVAASVSGGVTNNALLAPDGDPSIGPDVFTVVRGAVQAAYAGKRVDQILAYGYNGTFYAEHPEGDGQNHDLGWRLHATPTGQVEVRAQADASYSYLNSVNPITASPQTVATTTFVALPAGAASFYGLTARASGSYQPNAQYLWSEYSTVAEIFPVSGNLPGSFTATQDVHMERSRGRNAFTMDLVLNYLDSEALTATDGTVLAPSEVGGAQLLVGWKRDFSATVVGTAGVGVLVSDSLHGGEFSVEPVGQLTVRYQKGFALAEASLLQTSQVDPYLGEFLLTDMFTGRAFLALDRLERFHFIGVGSAQRGSVISGESLSTAVDLLVGDVGFSFRPLQYPVSASIDYNVQDQIGHTVGDTTFPSLHRQMVLLTLTGTWRSDTGLH